MSKLIPFASASLFKPTAKSCFLIAELISDCLKPSNSDIPMGALTPESLTAVAIGPRLFCTSVLNSSVVLPKNFARFSVSMPFDIASEIASGKPTLLKVLPFSVTSLAMLCICCLSFS